MGQNNMMLQQKRPVKGNSGTNSASKVASLAVMKSFTTIDLIVKARVNPRSLGGRFWVSGAAPGTPLSAEVIVGEHNGPRCTILEHRPFYITDFFTTMTMHQCHSH